MKTETILWLLPVVFMIHDFEEILFLPQWTRKHTADLRRRFGRLADRMLAESGSLNTGGFALAAAEEFVLLALFTLLAVEMGWYSFWGGLTLAFGLHLIMHLLQPLALGRYIPVVITSLLASAYCAWALAVLHIRGLLDWSQVALWAIVCTLIIAINLPIAIRLGKWLDRKQ